MPSFEVVCMSNSPISHMERFVEHYKSMGAERIRIFYDGDIGAKLDNFDIIECNMEFWLNIKKDRKISVEARQRDIYQHAYETSIGDWLLVVDIDEFVVGNVCLSDYLSRVEQRFDIVRFMPAEAVFLSDDNIDCDFSASSFRLPYPSHFSIPLSYLLYPGFGQLFIRGLLGHSRGKYAIRTGYHDVSANIHEAVRAEVALQEKTASYYCFPDRIFLAHFDAISISQWREKWRRRILRDDTKEMGVKRDKQMETFRAYDAQGRSEELFRNLYEFSKAKYKLLKSLGLAFSIK